MELKNDKNKKLKTKDKNQDKALTSIVLITNWHHRYWTGKDGNHLKALGVDYDRSPQLSKITQHETVGTHLRISSKYIYTIKVPS